MNGSETKKKGIGALDVLILILLAVVIGSVGLRYVRSRGSGASETAVTDQYVVSFQVKNIRNTSKERYMNKGDLFYLDENNQFFGTFRDVASAVDAQKYYEMPDGSIASVASRFSGDQYRVDVEASVTASGIMSKDRCFLLNGSRYIVLNDELKIHSKYVAFTVVITEIAKAQ